MSQRPCRRQCGRPNRNPPPQQQRQCRPPPVPNRTEPRATVERRLKDANIELSKLERLVAAERDYSRWQRLRVTSLEVELEQTERILRKTAATNSGNNSQVDGLRQGIQHIRQELNQSRQEAAALRAAAEEQAAALAAWKQYSIETLAVCVVVAAQNDALEADAKNLKVLVANSKAKQDQLEREKTALHAKCVQLGCDASRLGALRQAALREADNEKRARIAAQIQLVEAREAAATRIEALRRENQNFQVALQIRAGWLAAEVARHDETKAQLAALDAAFNSARAQWETEVQTLQSQLVDANERIEALEVLRAVEAAELETTKQELAAQQRECAELRDENDLLLGVVVALATALAAVVFGAVAFCFGMLVTRSNGEKIDVPSFDPFHTRTVIENERWYPFPFSKWSKKLLPTDRCPYTDLDGQTESKPPQDIKLPTEGHRWVGEWKPCALSEDSWIYAIDFPRQYYTENFKTACVRRRVHTREMIFDGCDFHGIDACFGQPVVLRTFLKTFVHVTPGAGIVELAADCVSNSAKFIMEAAAPFRGLFVIRTVHGGSYIRCTNTSAESVTEADQLCLWAVEKAPDGAFAIRSAVLGHYMSCYAKKTVEMQPAGSFDCEHFVVLPA